RGDEIGLVVFEQQPGNGGLEQRHGAGVEIDGGEQHVIMAAGRGDDEVELVGGAGTANAQGTLLGGNGNAQGDGQRDNGDEENGGEAVAAQRRPGNGQGVHAAASLCRVRP